MQGRFVAAAAVLLVLALAAGVHLFTTYDDYSRHNIQWNGTSSFFSHLEDRGAHEVWRPADLGGYNDAVLIVIAPQGSPDAEQIAAYRAFLARNNTVVLCDDFGSGNEFLAAVGSGITILPGNLTSVDRDLCRRCGGEGLPCRKPHPRRKCLDCPLQPSGGVKRWHAAPSDLPSVMGGQKLERTDRLRSGGEQVPGCAVGRVGGAGGPYRK